MRYQLQSLKKARKGESLLSQWANCGSSQQEKREFYYNIFLLDPNVAKTEAHYQAWRSRNVKQYYFTKNLHKERIDESSSVLETKQHCEALQNQAFQQVESALAVQSERTHIVLGSKAARRRKMTLGSFTRKLTAA